MSWWTVAWLGWGLYFVVVEGAALYRSAPGSTLSEHVWAFLGISRETIGGVKVRRQPSGWTRLRRFLILAFLAWLVAHFLTGGWF